MFLPSLFATKLIVYINFFYNTISLEPWLDTPGRRQLFEKGTLQHSISVTSQGTPSGITAASANGDFLALGQNL